MSIYPSPSLVKKVESAFNQYVAAEASKESIEAEAARHAELANATKNIIRELVANTSSAPNYSTPYIEDPFIVLNQMTAGYKLYVHNADDDFGQTYYTAHICCRKTILSTDGLIERSESLETPRGILAITEAVSFEDNTGLLDRFKITGSGLTDKLEPRSSRISRSIGSNTEHYQKYLQLITRVGEIAHIELDLSKNNCT